MPIGVMHLTDSLGAGGAERVAVNIVNLLPRASFTSYLCTTRADGALSNLIAADVGRLSLNRQGRFDWQAMRRLISFVKENNIEILHAHTTSLFIAALAAFFPPHPKVIWHDHYGRQEVEARPAWLYRQAARRVRGVIAVNQSLAEWAREELRVPPGRVWYVPNFTVEPKIELASSEARAEESGIDLTVTQGKRIVCVANFRRQKDHLTLIKAMREVVAREPSAHLILIGVEVDKTYIDEIRRMIDEYNLASNISWLGECANVAAILKRCDIGVISSSSEGLPLALLEYGAAGLAVVATQVGQCAEVLANGEAGILVSPNAPEVLAKQVISLLAAPALRHKYADKFQRRVKEVYSPEAALKEICRAYEIVIGKASVEVRYQTRLNTTA